MGKFPLTWGLVLLDLEHLLTRILDDNYWASWIEFRSLRCTRYILCYVYSQMKLLTSFLQGHLLPCKSRSWLWYLEFCQFEIRFLVWMPIFTCSQLHVKHKSVWSMWSVGFTMSPVGLSLQVWCANLTLQANHYFLPIHVSCAERAHSV